MVTTALKTETQGKGSVRRGRKRVSLDHPDVDVRRGDPSNHVAGRPEEQPARKHAPLPPKPKIINQHTIRHDMQMRMEQLEPALKEVKSLERLLKVIEEEIA